MAKKSSSNDFNWKEIPPRELPTTKKVTEINSFEEINPEALRRYKNIKDDEFERQQRADSYKLKRYMKWSTVIMAGIVTLLFFTASFSSYMGWITDKRLGDYFLQGVISFISAFVGFGIGVFYEQSKD